MLTFLSTLLAQRDFSSGKGEVGTGKFSGVATIKGLESVVENLVTVILGLAAIVLFIMFLSSGFKFMTAGGDPKAVESAQKTLTYSILGIVVIVAAFLFLRFVEDFTGVRFRGVFSQKKNCCKKKNSCQQNSLS